AELINVHSATAPSFCILHLLLAACHLFLRHPLPALPLGTEGAAGSKVIGAKQAKPVLRAEPFHLLRQPDPLPVAFCDPFVASTGELHKEGEVHGADAGGGVEAVVPKESKIFLEIGVGLISVYFPQPPLGVEVKEPHSSGGEQLKNRGKGLGQILFRGKVIQNITGTDGGIESDTAQAHLPQISHVKGYLQTQY